MFHIVLFAYPVKLNISTKNTVSKILPRKLIIVALSDPFNAISRKYWINWNEEIISDINSLLVKVS